MVIAGLVLIAGVYAAEFPSAVTAKDLGSASISVSSPSDLPPKIGWTVSARMIDGASVTWKPNSTGNFKIRVKTSPANSNGNDTVPGTNDVEQTDIIPLARSRDASDVDNVAVTIEARDLAYWLTTRLDVSQTPGDAHIVIFALRRNGPPLICENSRTPVFRPTIRTVTTFGV